MPPPCRHRWVWWAARWVGARWGWRPAPPASQFPHRFVPSLVCADLPSAPLTHPSAPLSGGGDGDIGAARDPGARRQRAWQAEDCAAAGQLQLLPAVSEWHTHIARLHRDLKAAQRQGRPRGNSQLLAAVHLCTSACITWQAGGRQHNGLHAMSSQSSMPACALLIAAHQRCAPDPLSCAGGSSSRAMTCWEIGTHQSWCVRLASASRCRHAACTVGLLGAGAAGGLPPGGANMGRLGLACRGAVRLAWDG